MGVDSNHIFYPDPVTLSGATFGPVIVNADVSLPTSAFDFEGAHDLFAQINSHEFFITALTGANNDLAFIARATGTTPTVRITYVDPAANNAALGVVVASQDITVNLATGSGGAITSTAAQVKAAIEDSTAASALVVVALAPSNDGTGVVTAMSQQTLAGPTGTTPTLDVKLQHGITATLADHSAFAQKTTAASEFKVFSLVGTKGKWVLDVGGTTPVFAVSITAVYRP